MANEIVAVLRTSRPSIRVSPEGVIVRGFDDAMTANFELDGRAIVEEASNPTGGIDMNSANLDLQIKRDGKGVPLPLAEQDIAQLSDIQGFVPVILEIKSATALPIFSQTR